MVAGEFRGRRLEVPPGDRVRPTSDRAREALFSILSTRVEGALVLDAFAGSGALGIEALSRGAAEAVFLESDGGVLAVLRANLASLFDRMYELRQRAARNAGFANFRDYIFPAKFRFDYTPADCVRFHEAVEATVAPTIQRCWYRPSACTSAATGGANRKRTQSRTTLSAGE